jgi:hypothetical protein
MLLHFFGFNEQQLTPQPELAMLFVTSWTPHGSTLVTVVHQIPILAENSR